MGRQAQKHKGSRSGNQNTAAVLAQTVPTREESVRTAPSVIDDSLPGGPRWMYNLDDHPIWVETKSQLRWELSTRGLVLADKASHNKDDQSPYATKTRLKSGAHDPFLPDGQSPQTLLAAHGMPRRQTGGSKGHHERVSGRIVTPTGELAERPTILLTVQEARLLRQYKRFLLEHGLKEALYCTSCWDHQLSHGTRAHVTPSQILIECRCRLRFYQGTEY